MHFCSEIDYEGKDFCANLKGTLAAEGCQIGTSYIQSITPSTSLGAEINHQLDAGTHLSFAGRYANSWDKGHSGDYAALQLSTMGFLVSSYCYKVNPYYSLASEFLFAPNQFGVYEPTVTVGGLWKYQTFRFQAKCTAKAELSAMLEHQIQPGLTFLLSGAVAHFKNTSTFGLGFKFGN